MIFQQKKKLLTRLDISKQVISEFIKKRTYDRISVVVFGEYAYLDTPLTLDKTAILSNISNIEIGIAGSTTAIGDAILLSVSKLQKKKKSSRAIILLTDGENTAGKVSPNNATKFAKKYKIPIYTIGIGKNGEAPFVNQFGQIVYQLVSLDIHSLNNIAEQTGGKFYNATNSNELKNIYNEINKLTKTKIETNIYYEHKSIYRYFLIFSLILIVVFIFFGILTNSKKYSILM